MSKIHGKLTVVTLDGNDLSPYSNTTSFGDSMTTHDTTTYGQQRKTYNAGLGDSKITIGGFYDNTAAGPRQIIKPLMHAGDEVEFIYQPEGAGTGKAQSRVNVIISSYNESSPVGDMVTWTAELQASGDLDETPQ